MEIGNTVLLGRYQLCRVLGCGRRSTVYLAKLSETEEYRAIKQVPKHCGTYGSFLREERILRRISQRGIPKVYGLEEDAQYGYLIEEFLEGDLLYALVSCIGHFSRTMTIRYGIQICRLVNILHKSEPTPILHLDLQPKNFLIYGDEVRLIDFDHAIFREDGRGPVFRYGTVGYAAPEQYRDEPLDERTDIYAIGAVLLFMLTGQNPAKMPKFPRGTGLRLNGIIRRCLQTDRKKRWESAARLETELSRCLKDREIQ